MYNTLINTPRGKLKEIQTELEGYVPDAMHSMLDKESKEDAIKRHVERKEKETTICPPTCSGIICIKLQNFSSRNEQLLLSLDLFEERNSFLHIN